MKKMPSALLNVSHAFQTQHIVTLKELPTFTEEDKRLHLSLNRVLQPGFTDEKDPSVLLEYGRQARETWITDFICPTVKNALKLNIAAILITTFRFKIEELENLSSAGLTFLLNASTDQIDLKAIEKEVETQTQDKEVQIKIQAKAQENFMLRYATEIPTMDQAKKDELLKIFISVETWKERKKITQQIIQSKLTPTVIYHMKKALDLKNKRTYTAGNNTDYSLLGAAGSGKSSIRDVFIDKNEQQNCINLCTDDYRGLLFDENNKGEDTDQMFVVTQDSAYFVKELIRDRLLNTVVRRPNILIDCVTLEKWHQKLLEKNEKTYSAVACLDDIQLVLVRALKRSLKSSNPADFGRTIRASTLIRAHARASKELFTSIPENVETKLYNTNVPNNPDPNNRVAPTLLAIIDTRSSKRTFSIHSLSTLGNFLTKADLNPEALAPSELFKHSIDANDRAKHLINLAQNVVNTDFQFLLKVTGFSPPYAEIKFNEMNGKKVLQMMILDHEQFHEALYPPQDASEEARLNSQILSSIVLQLHENALDTTLSAKVNLEQAVSSLIARDTKNSKKMIPCFKNNRLNELSKQFMNDVVANQISGKEKPISFIEYVEKHQTAPLTNTERMTALEMSHKIERNMAWLNELISQYVSDVADNQHSGKEDNISFIEYVEMHKKVPLTVQEKTTVLEISSKVETNIASLPKKINNP